MPMAAIRASARFCRTVAIDASAPRHHASGSCSAHPGCGVAIVSGDVAEATTSPDPATRIAFTPLVPTSRPRKTDSATSAHSEQNLHRQLIESLVGVALLAHRGKIELLVLDRLREILRELEARASRRATLA